MASFRGVSCHLTIKISNQDPQDLLGKLISYLRTHLDLQVASEVDLKDGSLQVLVPVLNDLTSLTCNIRLYTSIDLITINLEDFNINGMVMQNMVEENGNVNARLTNIVMDKFTNEMSEALGAQIERIPLLKRVYNVPNYFTTSDDRLLEYDFDALLFEKESDYQKIQIFHSPSFGNALMLDNNENMAESDINYTHALMDHGNINYEGKEILIMGGGDGALLNELLKERPKFVTMVEIDVMVIDACKKYLRGACGTALDQLKGFNYQIIIGDCIKHLEDCCSKGKAFDIIFNDLTEIPISEKHEQNIWNFLKDALNLSLNCLNPDGKYLTHVCIKYN